MLYFLPELHVTGFIRVLLLWDEKGYSGMRSGLGLMLVSCLLHWFDRWSPSETWTWIETCSGTWSAKVIETSCLRTWTLTYGHDRGREIDRGTCFETWI